jgi:ClpX C4-type zinc finger
MRKWIPWITPTEVPKVVYLSPSPPLNGDRIEVECSFCNQSAENVDRLVSSHGVGICDRCLNHAQEALTTGHIQRPQDNWHIADSYRFYFRDARRERQFLASVSFFVTFGTVRFIVRSIRKGHSPFHNISAGGRHIHHLVSGILTILGVGYAWLMQIGTGSGPSRNWMRHTAILYGAGSALTLDEFALWLNLSDLYVAKEGRESTDAVILFGSLLSAGFWGRPFLHSLARVFVHRVKRSAKSS